MKKRIFAAAIALVTIFALGGCGNKNYNLVMATGGTSGTYFAFGGAMAGQINSHLGSKNIKVTATSTGASMENIRNISAGEADLALVQNDVLDYANKGIELFDNEKKENLAVIATLYPEVVQIVVGKNSGINSVADLKGKKVSVGDVGSGVEANSKQILAAYGMTFEDINASHLSFKESANSFKDKQIDAFFVTSGVPNTAITELSVTDPIKVLNIEPDKRASLIEQYPFYGEFVVSKDQYNTDEDATTLAVMATLIVRKDMEEGVVYDITKALFDNLDELGTSHAKGTELSQEGAVASLSVDLHPGAAKYYKEIGVLK